ncbi:hypothetical protein AA0313_0108 [Acetobacter indonesiensis NRIC 0313]|uniref:IrrE N-terminal-like domain-containing protein n=2 Tax=Acetobacter indonesiensis TaxID=104101 RepID=A0A6N3T1T2_9PROT|nr:hypothetical protein Abin_060_083 [Acetobacter indonesiensis]GBQ52983.1 hypothetical protein AA0313_0108 [Acetobacter indonesiensis NRIC 0313]GEN03122.1 hypothetical protein AIN02nite_11470 [Acetobacter indonesiensis]
MPDHIMTPTDVLSQHWPSAELPIDPAIIARNAGIDVEPLPVGSAPGISGEYLPLGPKGRPVIYYNADDPENRIRFTIAHELGHHFLGHGRSFRDFRENSAERYNPCEVAANRFAADILMPRVYLNVLINKKGITSLQELTNLFQVSEAAMTYRLGNLGFLST